MTQFLQTCGSNLMCCAPCPPPDVTYYNFFDIASDEANLTQQEINIIVDYCHGPYPISTTKTTTTITDGGIIAIISVAVIVVVCSALCLVIRCLKKPKSDNGFNDTQGDTRNIQGNIGNGHQYTEIYTKAQENCTSIESNQQNGYFEMETTENTQNVCIIEGENESISDVNDGCSLTIEPADIRVDIIEDGKTNDIQDKIQTPETKLVNMKQFDTDHGVQQDTSYSDGESVKQRKVICEESFNKSNTQITRF